MVSKLIKVKISGSILCVLSKLGSRMGCYILCLWGFIVMVFSAITGIYVEKYQQCVIHTYTYTYVHAYLHA
jgi:hypothetical protein